MKLRKDFLYTAKSTENRIVEVARSLFAQKGFAGTTIKDIANEANVNISAISYHFNGKEGLFRRCIEEFGKNRLIQAEKILTPPDSFEDLRAKLKLWASQFLQCHVDDNQTCHILHRENVMEQAFMKEIFENTFLKAFESMVKFFEIAQKNKIIKKEHDPLITTALIYGALIYIGRTQDIQKMRYGIHINDPKNKEFVINQFVNILLKGISKNE